jgi:2-polyprenyl-3-methyl-5-hydroxy-6-metoxy-1,4-benzoquinol methylase
VDAEAWDERYAAMDLVWSAEPNRFVAAEFADVPPGRALDVAAGEGRNAIWLAARGWQVTAVDFSAVAIDKGRRFARAEEVDVDWVVADVLNYEPASAAYDAVVIAYLHLPPAATAQVFEAATRAVAPGGCVFVVGHDVTNIAEGVGGPQNPDLLYTPESVAAYLDGLDVVRAERVRRPVSGASVDAIDTVVTARRVRR